MPNRYQQIQPGQWRCPPGEEYGSARGLYYLVRTETEIDWCLQRNLYFLEDYFRDSTESEKSVSRPRKNNGVSSNQTRNNTIEATGMGT